MICYKKIFFLVFVSFFVSKNVQSQQYNFSNFSVNDGLAQSQVYAIKEDSRGYIWMGTQGGGLSRFDGLWFQNYSVKDGLLSNFVSSLVEDRNGNLIIGSSKGLSVFDGEGFENYCLDSNCLTSVQSIYIHNDSLLLAASDGVYWFFEGNFDRIASSPHHYFQTVFCDKDGVVWFSTKDSLYKSLHETTSLEVTVNNCDVAVTSFAQDDSSDLWIGSFGGGLCKYTNGDYLPVTWHKELRGARILSIYHSKGNLYIATQDKGLAVCNLDKQNCIFLTETDGLANNNVRCTTKDRLGNIWVGTSGGGVSKYSGEEFVHYNRSAGLSGNYIYAVTNGNGKMYVSTSGLGVDIIDENFTQKLAEHSVLNAAKIRALLVSSDSLIWCGSEGKGVFIVKGDSVLQHLLPSSGLGGAWINQIAEDAEGNVWIATTDGGITKASWENNQLKLDIFKGESIANNNVASICFDRDNIPWYATRYQGISSISSLKEKVVFDANNLLKSNNFRSILVDSLNYLWIGSVSEGIAFANLNQDSIYFQFLKMEDGLASNSIYQINLDQEQNIWIGSQKGLDKLSLDSNRNVLEITHFSLEEGFLGVETNANATCRDRDGNLWFGTVNGLTKYTPGNSSKNLIPPKLLIQDVSLFYESISKTGYANFLDSWNVFKEKVTFPYNQNHLSFDFIGINLSNPTKVEYQWKLEGFDSDWSPVSKKNSATYSNIPPGDYSFQVKASNEDGVWSEAMILEFSVSKAFWMETSFMVSLTSLFVVIITLIVYLRIKRIEKNAELNAELSSLEQKAMQLQMNPHFIFNTLNSIQGLIAENNNKDARLQLSKFSRLMRAILANSIEATIPLDQEITTLKNYLELEQSIQEEAFSYQINLDENVDPSFIEIPSMIIQPFLENAILHGIKSKGKTGEIIVSFSQLEGHLKCEVRDNGIGREAAQLLRKKQRPFHVSTALEVTRRRLHHLTKKQEALVIEDLMDENGKACGTKVLILLPLN